MKKYIKAQRRNAKEEDQTVSYQVRPANVSCLKDKIIRLKGDYRELNEKIEELTKNVNNTLAEINKCEKEMCEFVENLLVAKEVIEINQEADLCVTYTTYIKINKEIEQVIDNVNSASRFDVDGELQKRIDNICKDLFVDKYYVEHQHAEEKSERFLCIRKFGKFKLKKETFQLFKRSHTEFLQTLLLL